MEPLAAVREGVARGGGAFKFNGDVPAYGRVLEWLVYRLYRVGKVASGAYLFCTREAFEYVGGFDETAYGSEEAIMRRALRRYGPFWGLAADRANIGTEVASPFVLGDHGDHRSCRTGRRQSGQQRRRADLV